VKTPPLVLVLAILLFFAMDSDADDVASVVLYNGRIVTMTARDACYEAIALSGNRILSVGATSDMLALADGQTQRIDLQGMAVYPGFIDPHTHLLNDSWNRGLTPIETQALALSYGVTSAANM